MQHQDLLDDTVITPEDELAWARRSYETAPQPKGIGGWLVFPTIGLFGIALYATMALLRDHVPTLRLIMEFGLPPLHRAWVLLFAYDTLLTLALLGGAIVRLVLLFQKRRVFPKAMVWFLALSAAAGVVATVLVLVVLTDMVPDPDAREEIGLTTGDIMGDLTRGILPAAIWIPYFLLSQRVKNTFLNPPITTLRNWRQSLPGQTD